MRAAMKGRRALLSALLAGILVSVVAPPVLAAPPSITKITWGQLPNGQVVDRYTLTNSKGMSSRSSPTAARCSRCECRIAAGTSRT